MVEMPVMPQGTERRNCSKIVAVSKWKIGDERTGKNPTRRPGEETRAVAETDLSQAGMKHCSVLPIPK